MQDKIEAGEVMMRIHGPGWRANALSLLRSLSQRRSSLSWGGVL